MSKQPFNPPLLPPSVDLSSIVKLIVEANTAVIRYDEAVKRLPNPMIIQRSFETKEAVLSSKIEGTQATLEEVLELDAANAETEESRLLQDYREIRNYRRAIELGRKLLKDTPLSENFIKELHRLLLNSVRGEHKDPGNFRRHQVHIGAAGVTIEEASYVPPSHIAIPYLFSDLTTYMHRDDQPDRIVQAAIAHYQFEAIHPFGDGNGRVGRLLIPLYLYDKGITADPNFYISEFLEKHRRDYYENLNRVSEQGDWLTWITFFVRAVREQAKVALARAEKIEALYNSIHRRLPEFKSMYASAFLDAVFTSPVFTTSRIMAKAEIASSPTVYALIAKFIDAGLVRDMTPRQTRNKYYSFDPLVRILNENE